MCFGITRSQPSNHHTPSARPATQTRTGTNHTSGKNKSHASTKANKKTTAPSQAYAKHPPRSNKLTSEQRAQDFEYIQPPEKYIGTNYGDSWQRAAERNNIFGNYEMQSFPHAEGSRAAAMRRNIMEEESIAPDQIPESHYYN